MRRTHTVPRNSGSFIRTQDYQEADVPILGEVLFAAKFLLPGTLRGFVNRTRGHFYEKHLTRQ